VREGVTPPPSQHPRLDRGTLVSVENISFPTVPNVQSPRTLTAGVRAASPFLSSRGAPGTPLPLLVPQVDRDGNDRAGIRAPEVAVPLATYTGWNFRDRAIGGTELLFPLIGSYIPFAATRAEREANRDPRPSIEERYASRERYLALIEDAATGLVKSGYLLSEDVPMVVKRAGAHWDLLVPQPVTSTAAR
jgi:hypothetical protein